MANKETLAELLVNASPEELQRIIEESRDQLRKITKKEGQEHSEEVRRDLKPLEDQLQKAEDGYAKVKKAYDDQISKLKDQRKKAVAEADERRKAARSTLNVMRMDLGLKSTRKPSLGQLVSWYVRPNISKTKEQNSVTVGVQSRPESNIEIPITDEGKVDSKELKTKLFEEKEINDPGGGKLRGLVTRIKLAFIAELDAKEKEENLK